MWMKCFNIFFFFRQNKQRGEKTVHVHFHALLSEEFGINEKTDKVVLRSDRVYFGGWDSEKNVLKVTG